MRRSRTLQVKGSGGQLNTPRDTGGELPEDPGEVGGGTTYIHIYDSPTARYRHESTSFCFV